MDPRQIFLLLFLLNWSTVFSQYIVKGKVVSLPDKQPIPFTNIGIMNSSVGTIANMDGTFALKIPTFHAYDSVIFSALGYARIVIPVASLRQNAGLTIYLREAPYALSEVTLSAKRTKAEIFRTGNRYFEGGSVYADTVMAGSAMALLIQNKTYPVYIQNASVRIVNNTFGEFKVRVRLLEADTVRGVVLPGKDLLNQSVVTESKISNGWLNVDLSSFQLKMERDFFLAFEWILEQKDRTNLYHQYEQFRTEHPDKVSIDYSLVNGIRVPYYNYQGNFYLGTSFGIAVGPSVLKKNTSYYRLNSFGRWIPGTSVLAAYATLSNQPNPNPADIKEPENEEEVPLLSYYRESKLYEEIHDYQDVLPGEITDMARRAADPIRIELHRNDNQLAFFAYNLTFYPYQLIMDFGKIFNLIPVISRKTYTLSPGINRLVKLSVEDPSEENFHYELSVKELIGDPDARPQEDFIYLPPTKPFKFSTVAGTADENRADYFHMEKGDTLFAMRKGVITALPGQLVEIDRIVDSVSLEILQSDGTIMVYKELTPENLFVSAGEIVFPGQPLGLVDDKGGIQVLLFSFAGESHIKRMRILYFKSPDQIVNFENLITLEMNPKEKERYFRQGFPKPRIGKSE
ncbi:MAG: carboxypeptidase-like regulatory domain-containing protein [Bacteroidia bacterium]